jgi:hypothetical protein
MSGYPGGLDPQWLKELQERGKADLAGRFKSEHQEFLDNAKLKEQSLSPVIESLGVEREQVEQASSGWREAMRNRVRQLKPTPFKPLKGHNPSRYAPFDAQWSAINCGGINACTLYGPDAETGQIGADLASFNAGGAASGSAVGFWYFAEQEGNLSATAFASVWGVGYVYSALFGYASAYAGLRIYIYEYTDAGVNTYSATTDIYNQSGVLTVDVGQFNWVTRSVGLVIPQHLNTWYFIWVDAVQSAYAGGIADSVSNFEMYVGPVTYFAV